MIKSERLQQSVKIVQKLLEVGKFRVKKNGIKALQKAKKKNIAHH